MAGQSLEQRGEAKVRKKVKGKLIIIGGHEDKDSEGDKTILSEVAKRANGSGGRIVLVTAATQSPKETAEDYSRVFKELGVPDIEVLDVRSRRDAYDESCLQKLDNASVVFFTGGDQLRITSQMGYSPAFRRIWDLYAKDGATIAGTSAGAAAMPETMIIAGPSDQSNQISSIGMAPGLGLINGVVIDSHFAERGRFGRLLGAVAQNPRNLGLGIDEDTAVIIDGDDILRVIGAGAVYVVDGAEVSFSSLSEKKPQGFLSIYDVRLHVLSSGDSFDLDGRRPIHNGVEERIV